MSSAAGPRHLPGAWSGSERFEDLERQFYAKNWSVLLDLALLVRTLGGVVTRAWRFCRHADDALL